jgi:hypothetical protein
MKNFAFLLSSLCCRTKLLYFGFCLFCQAAERVLSSVCGNQLNALFLGNAPYGYLKYKFPESVRQRDGVVGAKVYVLTSNMLFVVLLNILRCINF